MHLFFFSPICSGWWLVALVLGWALTGCTLGPDYQPPGDDLPQQWQNRPSADAMDLTPGLDWAVLFHDPQLGVLIERALQGNFEAKKVAARLRQARARQRMVHSAAMAEMDLSAEGTRSQRSANVGNGSSEAQNLFQLGFDAGWELDIFGGVRRADEAATARLAAAGEEGHDVRLSLAAEVARTYLELRGTQQRLASAEKNLDLQGQTLELIRERELGGFGTRLDVLQAETQYALSQAQLPVLTQGIVELNYQLCLLLGLPPGGLAGELTATGTLPLQPALRPAGLPSDLLRRRPDIRRAERELAAATAEIGVTVAELFPRFTLEGLLGLQSNALGSLLSSTSRYWSAGPSVRWSLFNGGRVKAAIALNEARRDEARLHYQQTVLAALAEVESLLSRQLHQEQVLRSLTAAVRSATQAFEQADGRYRMGLATYLDVLQSQRALFAAQDQQLFSRQQLATQQVALFKALGGGWQEFQSSSDSPQPGAGDPQ
jgi:NodT family efflux transporter outer membrane factor (OMF) lipoprotein